MTWGQCADDEPQAAENTVCRTPRDDDFNLEIASGSQHALFGHDSISSPALGCKQRAVGSHQKCGHCHRQPNQVLPRFMFVPETDHRNEQQEGGEQQANPSDQHFTSSARFQKKVIWRFPQRLPEAAGFAQ